MWVSRRENPVSDHEKNLPSSDCDREIVQDQLCFAHKFKNAMYVGAFRILVPVFFQVQLQDLYYEKSWQKMQQSVCLLNCLFVPTV